MTDGAMFKRKYFKLIDRLPNWQSEGRIYISVDTALSTSNTADFTAITVVYTDRTGYYVSKVERERWDYEELKNILLVYYNRYKGRITFIIEPTGVGISLVSFMRKVAIPCLTSSLKDSKVLRACYAIPAFSEGRVYLVNVEGKNNWIEPFLAEFMSFPNGRHDDQVDSLVQLINYLEPRLPGERSNWFA